jgi:two-component system, sensor histidine kinase and response regulator
MENMLIRDEPEHKRTKNALPEGAGTATTTWSGLFESISHQIRTPMNMIMEMTELALDTDISERQREYLEIVRKSADTLNSVLNEVMDYSGIAVRGLKPEKIDFDLYNTMESVIEVLAKKAEAADLKLCCHIDPDVPTAVTGDPGRLRQIIVNLTENVIRSTPEGGVAIRLETEEIEDASATLHFKVLALGAENFTHKAGRHFKALRETDVSFTQEYAARGFGLTFSRQLVEMMGGHMWLEVPDNSQLQDNSQFQNDRQPPIVRLPSRGHPGKSFHFTLRFKRNHKKIGDVLHLKNMDISGIPVLIVDDNEINRLVFHRMTSAWGLIPAEAADGEEALIKAEKAFESGNPFRLMLVDLHMPDMDGFEVAKKIKKTSFGADVRIILLASVGQKGDVPRCEEVGISAYLPKTPVKPSEILDATIMTLGRETCEEIPVITRYTIQEAYRMHDTVMNAAA